jgi:predicted Zn-dependent protease
MLYRMLSSFALSSLESVVVAAYYAALYLTPANVRGVVRLFAPIKARIEHLKSNISNQQPSLEAFSHFSLVVLFGALLLGSPTLAQSTALPAPSASLIAAKLPPEIIALRNAGTAALFNIDYTTARNNFEEIRKQLPQHPAGDLYLAIATWLENLYKNRRLQTSLYREESSFYAGADKAKEETEGDKVDPAVDKAFRDRIQQAKLKALTLYNRDKKDPDALYFLGAVHGVLAGYEASTARKFFAALRNGSRNVDLHQKVIELKPDYYDAYLSIGMYHYVVGSLPFALKALVAIGGVRGNKQKGISELQSVVEKGSNADDASVLLLAIYQNEKRPADALGILQRLVNKYPRNYLLKLESAATLVELKRHDEAYATFESLLKDETAAAVADLVRFKYAEALAANKEYGRAAEQFIAVPQNKNAPAEMTTIALLRAGQVYDLAGRRNEAIAQYKAVLARANIYDSHEQAERGLKQAYAEKARDKKSE